MTAIETPRTSEMQAPHRSDDHTLAARVKDALKRVGYNSLHKLEVTILGGLVILSGRVSSYHLKQIGQATVLAIPGVRQVRNEVEVASA